MASLTDTKLRNAKPTDKPYKLQDGLGLFLDVRPSGAKIWRYRYWITPEKDGLFTIGEYPAVSLSDARREREWAREQVKQGLNPTHAKESQRLERMGYLGKFSGHGFRSTASTLLHELGWRSEVIERQLAHAERDKVKAAYNHAEYMPERREMMQAWADWIDELAKKAAENDLQPKGRKENEPGFR